MTKKQLFNLIENLASSQGFYSGIYAALIDLDADDRDAILDQWESMNFSDPIDFVLYLES